MARNCVCAMLCVLAAVAVLALLGSALFGASASSSHMEKVLEHVKQAGVVEFAVAFKPEVSEEAPANPRRHTLRLTRRTETVAQARQPAAESRLVFYDPSVVKVNGSLIPRTSEDSGQLRFDGWVQVETNTSEVHELVLSNHRGYRTIREALSMKVVSEGCLSTHDLPPLHALEAIPQTAFRADEFSAFGVNCTVGKPIEMLFMDVPFMFCADEVAENSALSKPLPLLAVEEAGTVPKMLAFHNKRVTIQANLVSKKTASSNKKKTESKELSALGGAESGNGSGAEEIEWAATTTLWSKKAKSVPDSCPYLEAPLTSGREKRSFLYHVLPSR